MKYAAWLLLALAFPALANAQGTPPPPAPGATPPATTPPPPPPAPVSPANTPPPPVAPGYDPVLAYPALALAPPPAPVLMDLARGVNEISVRLGYGAGDFFGVDLHTLQLLTHAAFFFGHVGGMVQIPISFVHVSGDDDSTTEFAIGNAEVAVLGKLLDTRDISIFVRGGVVLPLAGDSEDSFATNSAAIVVPRLTDLVMALPKTWTARLSATFQGQPNAQFFWRANAGVDVPITETELFDEMSERADPIIRINGSAGAILGAVTLSGELVNVIATGTEEGEDSVLNTFAVVAAFPGAHITPSVAIVLPIDQDPFDYGLSLGLSAAL